MVHFCVNQIEIYADLGHYSGVKAPVGCSPRILQSYWLLQVPANR
jgi:hypothetical protein